MFHYANPGGGRIVAIVVVVAVVTVDLSGLILKIPLLVAVVDVDNSNPGGGAIINVFGVATGAVSWLGLTVVELSMLR